MTKLAQTTTYGQRFFYLNRPTTQSGFSIIEYLATLVIAAILLVMTSSNFRSVADRSRVNAAMSDFHTVVLLARAEAMRRQMRVDIIPLDSKNWSKGWLVLIDANNNQQLDAGEVLLHRSQAETKGLAVEAKLRDSKKSYLAFDTSGRPRSAASSQVPQIGSFIFAVSAQRLKIIISFLGRVRVCDPDKDSATC
jgi:type IV fimbrial biogenesis protein FimT